jgi:peptidoglycan/xylan/chitin deacetylase (PgdA/CDA1 family)
MKIGYGSKARRRRVAHASGVRFPFSAMRRHAAAVLAALVLCAPPAGAATLPPLVEEPVAGISVVMFHQVSDDPVRSATGEDNIQHPWVSLAEFDDHLTQFERDGYHFVTPEVAEKFYLGELPASALPPKPLAITFDDGWANAFENGTAILLRHHAKAAMYFEGMLTDTNPLRLTTPQLKAMLASGAWTLQSHGWAGHSNIVMSKDDDTDPYWYANLMWLPAKHRLETPTEYEDRIYGDLKHFRDAFEPKLGIRIDSFAYPSGEHGQRAAYPKPALPDQFASDVHSNAPGLFPHLRSAMIRAGYRFAYAVDTPAEYHLANQQSDVWRLPRIGVGGEFAESDLSDVFTEGFELPAMSPDRQYAECGPLVVRDDTFYTASVGRPDIYRLDTQFHIAEAWLVPELMQGRGSDPSQIAAIVFDGATLVVIQNQGATTKAPATITRLDLSGPTARVVSRATLPDDLGYLVGAVAFDGRIVGLTDTGTFYDVATHRELFHFTLPDQERGDRFVGPVVVDGKLAAYDKRLRRLAVVRPDREVDLAAVPAFGAAGDVSDLVVDGATLYLNVWADVRHALVRFRTSGVR